MERMTASSGNPPRRRPARKRNAAASTEGGVHATAARKAAALAPAPSTNPIARLIEAVVARRKGADAASDKRLQQFQRAIGMRFKTPTLLRQALTHRSFVYDHAGDGRESNERMEFLGDSVLGLVVNEHLYKTFPNNREGSLTQMKSLLVSEAVLAKIARTMNLGAFLYLSDAEAESGGRDRSSILADAFEAVIAAIYLDGGLEPARRFCEERLLREAHTIVVDKSHMNHKSLLQEFAQGHFKTHPRYRVSREDGPDHEKTFSVEVYIGDVLLGRGNGKNKKDAEQDAARAALAVLESEQAAEESAPRPDRRPSRRGRSDSTPRRAEASAETPTVTRHTRPRRVAADDSTSETRR